MLSMKTRRCGTLRAPRGCPPTWFAAWSHSPGTGGRAATTQKSRPSDALDAGRLVVVPSRSGAGGAQRVGDFLDRRSLSGADVLPALTVGGSDLVGEVEDEATVVSTFLGGRLAVQ